MFYGEIGSLLIESGNSYRIYDFKNNLVKEVENSITADARNTADPLQQLDGFHVLHFLMVSEQAPG